MKTNTSMLKIAKNLGSVGLVFTITKTAALKTEMAAQSEAQVDAEIKSLSSSVQQALSQSGEGSEALADSEIQNMIQSQVENMVAEQAKSDAKAVSTHSIRTWHFFTISTLNESQLSRENYGWSKLTKIKEKSLFPCLY